EGEAPHGSHFPRFRHRNCFRRHGSHPTALDVQSALPFSAGTPKTTLKFRALARLVPGSAGRTNNVQSLQNLEETEGKAGSRTSVIDTLSVHLTRPGARGLRCPSVRLWALRRRMAVRFPACTP